MVKEPDIELRRVPGICCPEPTCDYLREEYIQCEGCGKLCKDCKFHPEANKQVMELPIFIGEWYKFQNINVKIIKRGNILNGNQYYEVIDDCGNMGSVNEKDLELLKEPKIGIQIPESAIDEFNKDDPFKLRKKPYKKDGKPLII